MILEEADPTNQGSYDRVLVTYGIYNEEMDRASTNNISALHNDALLPKPGLLRGLMVIIVFPGLLLYLLFTVMFLNENRTIKRHSKRRKLSDIIMASSGARTGAINPRSSHLQINESFMQESAKSHMYDEIVDYEPKKEKK